MNFLKIYCISGVVARVTLADYYSFNELFFNQQKFCIYEVLESKYFLDV